MLNGLWLELVRNVSVEQVILLEQKHFMGTYLSETRSLNLNLLEPKRYCLPGRRIFLRLPGNCKKFCLNNKQKHFVYIIKRGESLLPISQKTDDPDLQPLLGLTGECGGDNSCLPISLLPMPAFCPHRSSQSNICWLLSHPHLQPHIPTTNQQFPFTYSHLGS